jgi:hypothetical protein
VIDRPYFYPTEVNAVQNDTVLYCVVLCCVVLCCVVFAFIMLYVHAVF